MDANMGHMPPDKLSEITLKCDRHFYLLSILTDQRSLMISPCCMCACVSHFRFPTRLQNFIKFGTNVIPFEDVPNFVIF